MKKFLTIDDLIEFCMKNNFSKFSSKESNAEISVQMPAVATFGKSDDNKHTEGLCPFNATAYHLSLIHILYMKMKRLLQML